MTQLALFPLKTVLLPGNKLALKIFEPRYVDMIASCMRGDCRFGVVLIQQGEETSTDSEICSVGTTASIFDWQKRADGLLGITALGHDRFEVIDTHCQTNGLVIANINIISEADNIEIPEQYAYMQELLAHICAQEGNKEVESSGFVATLYQLIYLLPLDTSLKQRLLEVPDCNDRAMILHAELIRLGVIQYVKPDTDQPLDQVE
ncbi:MAG: peptidase S16 [Gammaproteobacteria bacterium]|nr:peptidase S16 [Gammaproteobacteria bacterium]